MQIEDKNLRDSINMINFNAKSKIKKCITCTNEEYAYRLLLQTDYFPDSNIMIIHSQKRLESLNPLLTLRK